MDGSLAWLGVADLLSWHGALLPQELKFRRGFQAKPSPLMQAAASLVATTPTPLRAARSSSNKNENATSLQTENVVVSVSMDKRTRMSKTPSPPTSPPGIW